MADVKAVEIRLGWKAKYFAVDYIPSVLKQMIRGLDIPQDNLYRGREGVTKAHYIVLPVLKGKKAQKLAEECKNCDSFRGNGLEIDAYVKSLPRKEAEEIVRGLADESRQYTPYL